MSQGETQYVTAGHGAETVLVLGSDELVPTLGKRFRVLAPQQHMEADGLAEFLAQTAEGPVHVVAESACSGLACWLAIRFPYLVRRLVLNRPECPNEALLQDLGKIQAETLLVWGTGHAGTKQGHVYQQHIPRAYRFFIYAPRKLVGLVTDFLERGEAFIVNTGEAKPW